MSKIFKFIKGQFPGAITGIFVALTAFYFTVGFDNANSENIDTQSAIELLQKTSEDIEVQAKFLENSVVDLNGIESYDDIISLRSSLDQFKFSGTELPYPVGFDKILDDQRVYSRLSSTGRRSVYRIQESLRKEKSYILSTSNEMQESLIDNDDYLLHIWKDPDKVAKILDLYVRMSNLKLYKEHLEVLSSILKIQAEYIQEDITEDEANARTSEVEIEAFKPQSTPLEQENILKEMEQIKESIRQLELESTTAELKQDPVSG